MSWNFAKLADIASKTVATVQSSVENLESSLDNTLGIDSNGTTKNMATTATATKTEQNPANVNSFVESSAEDFFDTFTKEAVADPDEVDADVEAKLEEESTSETEEEDLPQPASPEPDQPESMPAPAESSEDANPVGPKQADDEHTTAAPTTAAPTMAAPTTAVPTTPPALTTVAPEQVTPKAEPEAASSDSSSGSSSNSSSNDTPSETSAALNVSAAVSGTSSEEIRAALERAEKAEGVARKINRALKMRELQLEKQALECSNMQLSLNDLQREMEAKAAESSRREAEYEARHEEMLEKIGALGDETKKLKSQKETLRRHQDKSEGSKELLAAKDQQIAAVLKEGEMLSKKQGMQVETIRKQRKETMEKEKEIETLNQTLSREQARVEELEGQLKTVQSGDSQKADIVTSLNARNEDLNNNLVELGHTHKQLLQTCSELRVALEGKTSKVMEKDRLAQKLSEEMEVLERERDGLDARLKAVRSNASGTQEREDVLLKNVAELQGMLSVKSNESYGEVVALREEIKELQNKYRRAEERCEELVSAVPEATRPLLRQIQSLQTTMQERRTAWGETEASLKQRVKEGELAAARLHAENEELDEAQHSLNMTLAEKETKIKVLKERLISSEEAVEAGTLEAEELARQIKVAKQQLQQLRDRSAAELEGRVGEMRVQLEEERHEGQKGSTRLQEALDARAGLEQRVADLSAQLARVNERELVMSEAPSASTASADDQGPSSEQPHWGELVLENKSAMASTVEMLRAMARQKEGEINSLRAQLRMAASSERELSGELVALVSKLNQAQEALSGMVEQKKKLKTLSLRHAAALQLIGEKDEELADALEDLSHVKGMFRQQSESLLDRIQELEAGPVTKAAQASGEAGLSS